MSDRHQLTERIITRVKAIAIYTEGDSVEELTIEYFLLAFRSLEDEEAVCETLQVVFEDAEQICWPNGIKAFTKEEIEEIKLLEKLVDSKGINLSKELNTSYLKTINADPTIPLGHWVEKLLESPTHPVLLEFAEINGGVVQSQESLFEQWHVIQQRVAKLKAELKGRLTGQPTAISMMARAYRLRCQFPSTQGPKGILTVLGPRNTSKTKLARAFTDALSAAEGEKYQFFTSPEELEGTDEPSVFFLDNIEEDWNTKLIGLHLEEGKIGDADASNTWIISYSGRCCFG